MIIGKEISSSMFIWNGKDCCFSQEISSLGDQGKSLFSQLYDDSCDAGFVMVSHKTGNRFAFYLKEIHRNKEGEITHWSFKPVAESLRKFPHLRKLEGRIWND